MARCRGRFFAYMGYSQIFLNGESTFFIGSVHARVIFLIIRLNNNAFLFKISNTATESAILSATGYTGIQIPHRSILII